MRDGQRSNIVSMEVARSTRKPLSLSQLEPSELERGGPAPDLVASIRIELRRGGRVSHVVEGMTPGLASRFAACCIAVLADLWRLSNHNRR
jgi:hypothetical protein